MDKIIPPAAAVLLRFIRETETGRDGRAAYDVLYGHNEATWPDRLTAMTLAEVIVAGPTWTQDHGSSAAGAYQFMNRTLKDLAGELDLQAEQIFDPEFQDGLAWFLLHRRGLDEWIAGRISDELFAHNLAMEWASLPVLAPTRRGKRRIRRGQSYYAGDGLNMALVKPETVEAVLAEARAAQAGGGPATAPVPPRPKPSHEPTGERVWPRHLAYAAIAILAVLALAWAILG